MLPLGHGSLIYENVSPKQDPRVDNGPINANNVPQRRAQVMKIPDKNVNMHRFYVDIIELWNRNSCDSVS